MNMLDVRSLYVTYLSEEERVEAVRGIDFSAEEGKVTGIVGESGSGKSTAMLAVMGLPRLCGIGKNVHGGRQRKDRKNYWIRLVSATPG